MNQTSQTDIYQPNESVLLFAEFLHRIGNEYARTISFASLVARKSRNNETKEALEQVIARLGCAAELHRVLRPPIGQGMADFSDNLTQLCRAITTSFKVERRGIKLLLDVEEAMWLDVGRCWRASLIVSELINNACKHAFAQGSGRIAVMAAIMSGHVVCRVVDDGSACTSWVPGLGSHLVNALVGELGGDLNRKFAESGSTVTLSFPIKQIDAKPCKFEIRAAAIEAMK